MKTGAEGHFTLEEWADFVRGQVGPESRKRMQDHLDQGCRMCAQVVDLWRSVMDVGRREKKFQPLGSDIQWAKTLFAIFPPAKAAGLKLLIARLACSSELALEGVRGYGPSLGHFIFQKEDLMLDLQFRAAGSVVAMVGQVLDSADQGARYGYTTVKVMTEEGVVAQTTTNEFGEFRLEYSLQPNLLLVIELEGTTRLVTPLPHPSET
jgi:hypothetical protein